MEMILLVQFTTIKQALVPKTLNKQNTAVKSDILMEWNKI
jgi:hypothetical protein